MSHLEYIDPLTITGFINNNQINTIKLVCDSINEYVTQPKFLEIGVGFGRSTAAWLNDMGRESSLTVVDTFNMSEKSISILEDIVTNQSFFHSPETFEYDFNRFKQYGHLETWKQSISSHVNFSKITVNKTLSQNMILSNTERFDCVYIDALETYDEFIDHFKHFSNSLVICGDDYNAPKHSYITDAVYDFERNSEYELYTFPRANFFILADFEISRIIQSKIV